MNHRDLVGFKWEYSVKTKYFKFTLKRVFKSFFNRIESIELIDDTAYATIHSYDLKKNNAHIFSAMNMRSLINRNAISASLENK
jgi:hypothetical protein